MPSVPVFLVGRVVEIQVDIGMDGAKYLLISTNGTERLKSHNPEVDKVLKNMSGKKHNVMVAGYRKTGPESSYIEVYYAEVAQAAVDRLTGKPGEISVPS
jgi:hypothetical protein